MKTQTRSYAIFTKASDYSPKKQTIAIQNILNLMQISLTWYALQCIPCQRRVVVMCEAVLSLQFKLLWCVNNAIKINEDTHTRRSFFNLEVVTDLRCVIFQQMNKMISFCVSYAAAVWPHRILRIVFMLLFCKVSALLLL